MTQAEKAQLRYIALLTQNQQVQGDMGRTIMSSANAIRVLKEQFTILGREIGNIFIPILMKIVPVAIAVVKVLAKVAKAIANLMGFELPDLNWDSVSIGSTVGDGVSDSLDGATSSAKALKRQLAGFDELNNLTSPTPSSGGGGAGGTGGAGFDLELPEYDMLEGFNKGIDDMTDKIMKFFGLTEDELGKLSWSWSDMDDKAKAFIITLGALATIKGLTKIASTITTLSTGFGILSNGVKKFFGLFVGKEATGSVGLLGKISTGFSKVASALGLTSGGLILVIAAIAAVVATFIHAYKTDEKFKQSVDNLVKAFRNLWNTLSNSIKPIMEQLQPLIDVFVQGMKTGVGELLNIGYQIIKLGLKQIIDGITASLTMMNQILQGDFSGAWQTFLNMFANGWNNAKESMSEILPSVQSIFEGIGDGWQTVVNTITNLFKGIAEWFYNKVIKPIGDFFSGLFQPVINIFQNIWNKIVEIWNKASTWFDENVIQPIVSVFKPIIDKIREIFSTIWQIITAIFGVIANWVDENVIQPTLKYFKDLWEGITETVNNIWTGIKDVFGKIANWINANVIQPVKVFFTSIFNTVSNVVNNVWNTITNVFGRIASWVYDHVVQPVKNFFIGAWNSIGDTVGGIIRGAVNGALSGVERVVNFFINGLNKVVDIVNNLPGVNIGRISPLYLPRFEKGGFPGTGQFFIARESGPELVGQIGNRTAVANNDQIVAGIQQGVYNAMVNAQSEQSSSAQNIYIGNRQVYRSFTNGLRTENNRLGTSVVRV